MKPIIFHKYGKSFIKTIQFQASYAMRINFSNFKFRVFHYVFILIVLSSVTKNCVFIFEKDPLSKKMEISEGSS